MTVKEAYNQLIKEMKNIFILENVENMLEWDFETYMPTGGGKQRSKELALLAGLVHDGYTSSTVGKLIKDIKSDPEYNSLPFIEKRNVHLMEREYDINTRVPKELVEKIAEQSTIAIQAWKKAKEKKDYLIFKPELDKILNLAKEKAHFLAPEKNPLDALLDEYEPGFTSEMIDNLFNELREGIIPIIKKCQNASKQPDMSLINRNCSIDIQKMISEDVSKLVLYDLERGRIDETEHPFTNGYYDDVRITTHYYENNFASSFYSVMHEAGHALYEQNLDKQFIYQALGKSSSYGIHESQSRFIENLIGRSPDFWEHYLPKFKEITGDIFSDVDLDAFTHAINEVKPSKIRIEADEVTYSLHVIIRFEIEKDLLSGKITTDELPSVWNTKYKEYLGVDIENDSEGVMQDTHWAAGYFGYFPSYVLGNMYNGQMLNVIKKEFPYNDLIKKGDLKPIINWLIENVHKQSNLYDPLELIKKISGEEINPKYFIDYLEEKYSRIYNY
ncbi:MAG: carboxypeptidase M32 [Candidatus Hodarchaeales archaeon]|jgi:carboxypeptidase Taq